VEQSRYINYYRRAVGLVVLLRMPLALLRNRYIRRVQTGRGITPR